MVALSICVFTVVKIYSAPAGAPVSQLTPASASSSSNGRLPVLPELSAQTRQQLQAPAQPGAGAPPGAPAVVPDSSAGGHSPDGHSPDGHSPDGRWQDGRWQDGRPPQNLPRAPGTRVPNAQVANPARAATPPGPAQRPGPATGRASQDPNRLDAAEATETAAPAEPPEVIYIPETPEERDARIRRELADSVCDQYGVQREACRARTARR